MKLIVSLFVLLLSVHTAFGQFKNIKLDEQSENDYMCEPSIAINPKNPLNIVAASVLNNIYFTKDGGITWQKREVKSSFGVYGDPALIADGSGTFFFFHLSDPTDGKGGYDSEKLDRIVVQRSEDGGDTWDDGTSIGFNHPKDQDKQWPAIDSKGNLMLAWTQFDSYGSKDAACQSNIMLSTSKNGSKWSEPLVISQLPGNCLDNDSTVMGAMPVIAFDGKAFVAWAVNEKIYMDRSFDGNLWLSNDIPILDQKGGWDLKIPGHDRCNGLPVFMTDRSKSGVRGYLYMVWADQRNGETDTDVWFSRSTNYGDNWSIPLNVSIAKKNHQYLPWMAIDQTNSNIYIMYYDRSEHHDLKTDVYLAWSTDGGNTFRNAKISETPFVPGEQKFFGDYTNLSAHKGIITPVWTRMDNGKTSVWTSVIKHSDLEALAAKTMKFKSNILIVPGLGNSGPGHWQTIWETEFGFKRIQQRDWETPERNEWIDTLQREIIKYDSASVILVGHSLACSTIGYWSEKFPTKIKGALLVAPSDTESEVYPPGTTGFKPMPLSKLPFRSTVISSTNDMYVSTERANQFANAWGSKLILLSDAGHINVAAGFGKWPGGLDFLKELDR